MLFMGKSTISMAIFNSYFDITRGYWSDSDLTDLTEPRCLVAIFLRKICRSSWPMLWPRKSNACGACRSGMKVSNSRRDETWWIQWWIWFFFGWSKTDIIYPVVRREPRSQGYSYSHIFPIKWGAKELLRVFRSPSSHGYYYYMIWEYDIHDISMISFLDHPFRRCIW